jgi:hypothetical protein
VAGWIHRRHCLRQRAGRPSRRNPGLAGHPAIRLGGEAGRLTNVLSRQAEFDLNEAARAYVLGGRPLSSAFRMPATYGFAGVRYTRWHNPSGIAAFVEGGAGAARLSDAVSAVSEGADVSATLKSAAGLTQAETKPLAMVGVGFTLPAGRRTTVDVDYRFGRVFAGSIGFFTNRVAAAVRVGF